MQQICIGFYLKLYHIHYTITRKNETKYRLHTLGYLVKIRRLAFNKVNEHSTHSRLLLTCIQMDYKKILLIFIRKQTKILKLPSISNNKIRQS